MIALAFISENKFWLAQKEPAIEAQWELTWGYKRDVEGNCGARAKLRDIGWI